MLTKDDYQSALDVQSAVNLSGLLHAFSGVMQHMAFDARSKSTEWKNRHPIVRLFVTKLVELSDGLRLDGCAAWCEASDFCEDAAAGRHAHLVITVRGGEVVEYEVNA